MRRFAFAWDPTYARLARPFGIRPEHAWVEVGEDELDARYGRWRLRTPLANVNGVAITGPYRLVKTAGPPRMGVTDFGLTFASNGDRGVLMAFGRRVRAVGPVPHGELTVTVADPEGLANALREHVAARSL